MRRYIRYILFCIEYPFKRWLRKRWEKARDDGWDEWRKAGSEDWKEKIVERMFNPEGDIYKFKAEEDERRSKLVKKETVFDGIDSITFYEEESVTMDSDNRISEMLHVAALRGEVRESRVGKEVNLPNEEMNKPETKIKGENVKPSECLNWE